MDRMEPCPRKVGEEYFQFRSDSAFATEILSENHYVYRKSPPIDHESSTEAVSGAESWRANPTGPFQVLLTAEQLGKRLGVSRDTIDRWERQGYLPPAIRNPKNTPSGRGRGRCYVRWDLWKVMNHLSGQHGN